MVRVVFMGSPDWAVPSLLALADALAHPAPGGAAGTLIGACTQPDRPKGRGRALEPCPVKRAALGLGLPVRSPASLKDPAGQALLAEWRPELVIVCAYGLILPRAMLDLPRLGCYNLHFSLLPRWRGATPVQAAVLAGDAATGVSLQRMVEALDAGPLVASTPPLAIGPDDDAASLGVRLAQAAAGLLRETLPSLLQGHAHLAEQDASQATFCRRLSKADGAVRFEEESALTLERKVRAYQPWPGCHAYCGGLRLALERVEVLAPEALAAIPPGTVPGTLLAGGVVPAAQGAVRLLRVKPQGKASMPWHAFAHGHPQALGCVLRAAPPVPSGSG